MKCVRKLEVEERASMLGRRAWCQEKVSRSDERVKRDAMSDGGEGGKRGLAVKSAI